MTDTREAWLEARRSSIGSSDAPALLGESPFASRVSVWADKIGQSVAPPPEVEERLAWGKLLEPVILEEYARRRGVEVKRWPQDEVIRHPRFPEVPMHATPDAEDDQGRVIEVKNWSAFATSIRELREGGAPMSVLIQNQHELACMDRKVGTIVILLGGSELWWSDVGRNDRFVRLLEERCSEFWQRYVVTRIQPPADGHPATVRALERLHPEDSGETVVLPDVARIWDERLQQIRSEIKALKDEKDQIENDIKAALGAATFGEIPGGGLYKWATQERREHTVSASRFRVLRRVKG